MSAVMVYTSLAHSANRKLDFDAGRTWVAEADPATYVEVLQECLDWNPVKYKGEDFQSPALLRRIVDTVEGIIRDDDEIVALVIRGVHVYVVGGLTHGDRPEGCEEFWVVSEIPGLMEAIGFLADPSASVLAEQVMTTLSDQDVEDIVETAMYGGYSWWVQPRPEEFGKDGFTFVTEDDDRTVHQVSHDDVRRAYAALLEPDQTHVGSEIHGYVVASWQGPGTRPDLGEIDLDAADAIIQLACLGEITYG